MLGFEDFDDGVRKSAVVSALAGVCLGGDTHVASSASLVAGYEHVHDCRSRPLGASGDWIDRKHLSVA